MSAFEPLDLLTRAAKAAGARLAERSLKGGVQVLADQGKDLKLSADREAEAIILDMLKAESAWPILTEESGEHGDLDAAGPRWIVDPLDGTFNFSRGLGIACVSIGLMENNEPRSGVIYDFNRDVLYAGTVGHGAWKNGEALTVSTVSDTGKAVLATGFPVQRDYGKDALERFYKEAQAFKKVRMFGSAALSLAFVAEGVCDAYAEDAIMLWDVAAGLAIVQAAGGWVSATPSQRKPWAMNVRTASCEAIWQGV